MSRLRQRALVALILGSLTTSAWAEPPEVIVWPRSPRDQVTGVATEVGRAGFRKLSFAPLADRLRMEARAQTEREATRLTELQAGLERVRSAYLRQHFAAMIEELEALEKASLAFIARPKENELLWQLQFLRGLAHQLRNQEGDRSAAQERFQLALDLDPGRMPRRELYGPDAVRAFSEAADVRELRAPLPVSFRVEPKGARLSVDGTAVLDPASPRRLRAGLHVLHASAVGYEPRAKLVRVDEESRVVELALLPRSGDALARIGASWSRGELYPQNVLSRAAIARASDEAGAIAALVIEHEEGAAKAQIITARGEAGEPHSGQSLAALTRAVLSRLAQDGSLRSSTPILSEERQQNEKAGESSIFDRWWFWTAVGVVATGAASFGVYTAIAAEDELQVLPPKMSR